MQAAQESKWTTDLRQEIPPTARVTRMKVARKKKLKQPLPEFDGKAVPIQDVVEDVLQYMMKKEKIVAKINDKKNSKQNDKQDIEEVKSRIANLESNVSNQFTHFEQNLNILKGLFDDMKRSNEERHAKWESDLNSFKVKMETKSDKEKSKFVATLQKIHKEHNSAKKLSDEYIKKVEHQTKKTTQSITSGMEKLSTDMNHVKDDVNMLLKKRFGRAMILGGGDGLGHGHEPASSALNTSITSFCSVDEGVDLLAHRMSKLDSRIADIEQGELATHSQQQQQRVSGVSSRRKAKEVVRAAETESVDTLQEQRVYEELENRVRKTEAAVARIDRRGGGNQQIRPGVGTNKRKDRGSGSEDEEDVQQQVRALQRKVRALGDSTSRACRSLSVGVTDAQNASLQLFSWADKVHGAFERVSKDCLKVSKNILPRAKLLELTAPPLMPKESNDRKKRQDSGRSRRSASAGGGRRHTSGVESDYEINF